ncbi:protein FANTASTIC FOUR 2-like [Rutidosis leptorrhynchoides]|uniref:protein FANTASTIC FOUR 2-like n=1 Tax=Rutidosis leptorrhynchoides TaxID=125765 RepID=UPI003A99C97D
MASSIVCQGLQSCLEHEVTLSLPTKIQETNNVEVKINNGWSFSKILDQTPSINSKNFDQNDNVYIHPLDKRSASSLSTKSLEMCTESLGSETGSDVLSESGDDFSFISDEERERLRAIQKSKFDQHFDRKVRRSSDFPPPLTSISGSNGTVKVNHHREGGRLVIKAVSFSNRGTNFQVERTNGTLKLSLLKNVCVNYESEGVNIESSESERVEIESFENEGIEMENYDEGGMESETEYDNDNDNDNNNNDDNDDNNEVGVIVAEDEEEGGGWRWDMDGNRWTIAGKGELRMLTRCKEGGNENKVFANWGSSWVAIS